MAEVVEIPTEELPYWMRQARRRWDWGLLLAVIFGVLAAWPFIVRPGLPRTNASENYVFMAADDADALREGRLYPRWSPNALGGLGAPIPHYHPPGAAYAAGVVKVLFTNDPVRAVRIIFIAAFIIAAVATYAFVKRRASASAGLLAVILFIYNPYVGNIAPYVRGDLAECLALALVPLLLWVMDRLLLDGQPSDLFSVAGVSAALMLAHPATAAVALGLTALLTFYHAANGESPAWVLALIATGLGIALAAFYWMPAFFERDLVQWIEPSVSELLRPAALFSPLQSVDLNALIPMFQPTLGTPIAIIAIAALISMAIIRRGGIHLLFLTAALGLIAAGIFLFPREVWLLGPISLCLAVCSSGLVMLASRLPRRWRRLSLAAMLTGTLSLALPVLPVPVWPSSFGGVQPIDQIAYEQQGDGIAVLPPTFPLPLPLPEIPPANRLLLSGYEAGNINKIVLPQAGSRTQINLISHETHRDRFQVLSNTSTVVNLLTTYFPGWQAMASGQPIEVKRQEQTNLISLELPPMSGELVVTLGSTPIRQTAWLVSTGALIIILLFTWQRMSGPGSHPAEVDSLAAPEARLFTLIVLAFGVIVVAFTTPSAPLTLYERPGHELDRASLLRRNTNVGLEALAFAIDSPAPRPGETLEFDLYWQAQRPLPGNYQVQVQLIQSENNVSWYQTEFHSPGGYPTSRWRTYLYLRDHYTLPLPDTLPPGDYEIAVEVFNCSPGCDRANRLTFFNVSGQNVGQILTLPVTIQIE